MAVMMSGMPCARDMRAKQKKQCKPNLGYKSPTVSVRYRQGVDGLGVKNGFDMCTRSGTVDGVMVCSMRFETVRLPNRRQPDSHRRISSGADFPHPAPAVPAGPGARRRQSKMSTELFHFFHDNQLLTKKQKCQLGKCHLGDLPLSAERKIPSSFTIGTMPRKCGKWTSGMGTLVIVRKKSIG